jgi:hypothetical protein
MSDKCRKIAGCMWIAAALIAGCSDEQPRELNHTVWMRGTFPTGRIWLEFLGHDNSIAAIYSARDGSERVYEKIEMSAGKLVRVLRDTNNDGRFDMVFSSVSAMEEMDEPSPTTRELDRHADLTPYHR